MQRVARRAGEAALHAKTRSAIAIAAGPLTRTTDRARLHRARWRWRRSCRRARRSYGARERKRRALAESPARLDRDSARVFFARRIGEARRDDGDAFRAVVSERKYVFTRGSSFSVTCTMRRSCEFGSPSRPRRSRRRPSRPALRHGRGSSRGGARSRVDLELQVVTRALTAVDEAVEQVLERAWRVSHRGSR